MERKCDSVTDNSYSVQARNRRFLFSLNLTLSEKRDLTLRRMDKSVLPLHILPLENELRAERAGASLNEGRHPASFIASPRGDGSGEVLDS